MRGGEGGGGQYGEQSCRTVMWSCKSCRLKHTGSRGGEQGDALEARGSGCKEVRFLCVPACVRVYADRRPGFFYTLYGNFLANSCDFGSAVLSSFVNLVIFLV